MSLKQIIPLLKYLNATELERLQSHIKALGQFAPIAPMDDNPSTMALECIHYVLAAIGCDLTAPPIVRRQINMTDFNRHVDNVMLYLQPEGAPKLRPAELRLLLIMGVELLYRQMCSWGLPISGATVARHFRRLPTIINNEYPGYREAGLLHMLINPGDRHARKERRRVTIS